MLLGCMAGAPLMAEESPEMDAFRKQIEGELATMKASYEGRIKVLESRIGTLEGENTRLKQQGGGKPTSTEMANINRRVTDLETMSGQIHANAARSQANEEEIKTIQLRLHAGATESREIYGEEGGWPFDLKSFYELPQPLEFHGYMRAGYGMNGEGGHMEAFKAPGAGAKYRLGNEQETYIEQALTHNWLRIDNPTAAPYVRTTIMASYTTGENNTFDSVNNLNQGNDFALRQGYVEMGNVLESAPEARFWAGQRYYQRHDIHINDFYYLDMSGYGGGVEDLPLWNIGKLQLAWLGGTVDQFVVEDRGVTAKQSVDLRITDIKVVPRNKLTLWFDYSNTKGGEVHDVFNPDGSLLHIQSSDGAAVGLILRTEEIAEQTDNKGVVTPGWNFFGGYNEFTAQYGRGAAFNFATSLDTSGPDLDSAEHLRFTDHFTIQPSPHFAMQAAVVYDNTKFGGDNSRNRWISVGMRPIYYFNDRFSIALETGVDWDHSQPLDTDGHLWKITLAPQISRGNKFFSRPAIRAFVTYAKWSDGFRGHVGGPAYLDDTAGWSYGIQTEAWW
jgi:maltoporin